MEETWQQCEGWILVETLVYGDVEIVRWIKREEMLSVIWTKEEPGL